MPLFKFFKALICKISHGPLTSSKANFSRFVYDAPSERLINIFKNINASIVTIIVEHSEVVKEKNQILTKTRSGVVWDTEGHIVTNYHVIKDNISSRNDYRKDIEIYILTSKGVQEKYIGKLVGANCVDDLAVLKIRAPKNILKPITVGESTIVEVGQTCFVIGALSTCRHIFTTGIISGLNRDVIHNDDPQSCGDDAPIRGLIQADSYTHNESGGSPLLDYEGHMIGITIRGCSVGVGFAIPSSVVVKIINQLTKYNNANCPGLNIVIEPDYASHEKGIWTGAVVSQVTPHSLAAGFHSNNFDKLIIEDIIIAVGDRSVSTKGDLFEILEKYRAGDTIILTVIRCPSLKVTLSIIFEDY